MVILSMFMFIFKIAFILFQWFCSLMFVLVFLLAAANIFIWFACRNDVDEIKNDIRGSIKESFLALLKIVGLLVVVYVISEIGLYLCNI